MLIAQVDTLLCSYIMTFQVHYIIFAKAHFNEFMIIFDVVGNIKLNHVKY